MSLHQVSMFATLSAILHLGNMEISDDKDGNAALGNNKHFQVVNALGCVLGVLSHRKMLLLNNIPNTLFFGHCLNFSLCNMML